MQTIIGIDPGMSGGIAILQSCEPLPRTMSMPETDADLFDCINFWNSCCMASSPSHRAAVYVEKVNAGPKMGSSASFKFGQNVGAIRMACLAAGVRLEYVTPQKWQREFGLIVKGRGLGQDDTSKKNRNKARAQELYPGIKITHAIADALLLAEYGRRQQL